MKIRKAETRGHADFGWLSSWHSFSFGDFHDPAYMNFGPLRVINDDTVTPGAGFDTHSHRDMEIISYVLEGALQHKDSTGGGSIIRPGEVQRMSAGTGIRHSEFNASDKEPVHFLQIWIIPNQTGIAPGYEQKLFPREERKDRLRLVGSPDGRDGSLVIHQDTDLYASVLGKGQSASHTVKPGRGAWVQMAAGSATVNGERLDTGDGAAIAEPGELTFNGVDEEAEFLVFDLAA